ncbi:Tyrocidine synthase 3 [Metarhizium brunneum]|uniref:Tyrocidine synthase 3 n=1 Tax=Metarhizium brunneum TaxID=500148 RepID=A0A7D5YVD0_9HYPO|nr:Tyrocidine synthase 3 [Metarhizium brunneum]
MGEIAVAGHVLARGYVNNASLTAKHFVQASGLAAGLTPSRICLTGDTGRCTADGSICLVGRKDQMVKVKGIRVESTESEQQLQQQGGMFASCVAQWLREEESIAKLAAFVQLDVLSSKLAARLGSLGIASGNTIPLLVSKSAVAIVSMFAMLKAGAAYVPLALDSAKHQLELLRGKLDVEMVLYTPDQASKLLNYPVKVVCCTIEDLMLEEFSALP